VRLLRDKAGLTKVLALLELQRSTHTRLRSLADALGMTVQGASNYVAALEEEGLMRVAQGRYEVTPKGLQRLQEHLAELKGFVDLSYQRVNVVQECAAMAGAKVQRGQEVGLFLEEGVLVARPRTPSPSKGIAAHDAARGDLVRVRDLAGLVALRPGKLAVVEVPLPGERGTAKAAQALHRAAKGFAKVGAVGTEAQVLARAAGLGPDFLFAPTAAAHHAAQLGLDVLLAVAPEQARFVAAELDRLNDDALEPIAYDVRTLRRTR
jgi:putative transcriptional regulator